MDELHTEINNLKAVKRDSKSLTHFATTIACYVSDMEDNIGCPVLESVEAPFLMSQLLSKLDPSDNSDFDREMKRERKEETVSNLITWLHQEASIRSRGKANTHWTKKRICLSLLVEQIYCKFRVLMMLLLICSWCKFCSKGKVYFSARVA